MERMVELIRRIRFWSGCSVGNEKWKGEL